MGTKTSVFLLVVMMFVTYILAPVWAMLSSKDLADYILRQFVYKRIAERITQEYKTDWEVARALNQWVYLNEMQNVSWLDGEDGLVDYNPMFDMVRGIGWCDQKAWALVTLLAEKGIKARSVGYPSHTITEVEINQEVRYYGSTYNRELIYADGKYIPIDGKGEYEVNAINKEVPKYGDYNNQYSIRNIANILLKCYNNKYIDIWIDLYFKAYDGHLVTFKNVGHISQNELAKYTSKEYEELYKVRIYHLLGEYNKALPTYEKLLNSKQFRDEAVYFMMMAGYEMKDTELIDDSVNKSNNGAIALQSSTNSYLWFIPEYMRKYGEANKCN